MISNESNLDDSERRPVTSEPQDDTGIHHHRRKSAWKIAFGVFFSLLFFVVFCASALYVVFFIVPQGPEIALLREMRKDSTLNMEKIPIDESQALAEVTALKNQVDTLSSEGAYLIVNTTDNRFYLYNNNMLIREGRCSTGKNTRLIDPKRNNHVYEFKTPRGVHKVISKQEHPVWTKPNWAYIEEGLPIPSPSDKSRFDENTLGDYKLNIGDGYMVHGTIWKRRMGLPVTHGCVRLLDEDLEVVYHTLDKGSKVIIY